MKDWTINLEDLKEFSKKFEKQNDVHVPDLLPNTIQMLKKGGGIHIKKANKGKFTASAKRAGRSVQEHARAVLADPNATPLQKKRANFARNATKWHKK